jgi:hypothetical protein
MFLANNRLEIKPNRTFNERDGKSNTATTSLGRVSAMLVLIAGHPNARTAPMDVVSSVTTAGATLPTNRGKVGSIELVIKKWTHMVCCKNSFILEIRSHQHPACGIAFYKLCRSFDRRYVKSPLDCSHRSGYASAKQA